MNGFRKVRIAEQAKVLMGQSPPSSACSEHGEGLPFIQGNAEFGVRYPVPQLKCSVPTRIAEAGDLLLSVRAPVGELNQANTWTVIGRGLSAIRFQETDRAFAWHVLKWSVDNLGRVAQGSTFVAVSRQDVENLEIPWCESDENKRIAAVLDTVDEAIAKTEAVIAKLKQVRAGLLHDLLTRGLDENGQLRDPIAHPEQFQDSPIGRIPRGWEATTLVSKISLPQGQVDPRVMPYAEWILIAPDHIEVGTGRLIATQTAKEQIAISGKYVFQSGDIIYSKIRPYLRKAILASFQGLCSADMYPLRPIQGVNPRFLLAVILGERFSRFASAVSMRSGFPKINREELAEFEMAWPKPDEQERIAKILSVIDVEQAAVEKELAKLRQLKSALMADLLTGRVRVPANLEFG